jgi:2-desacetyl-2-hydroxyethyl bacteriochlorophyllide A dehydrogenase
MKAAILFNDRDIRHGETKDPGLRPDEVLIATQFAGICGTDVHIYRGEFHERVRFPAIQGHEFGGVIQEVGSQIKDFQVGDRVVVDPILSCHQCTACRTGHLNACQYLKLLGVDLPGGYAQYVAAPASQVYRLPDEIPMTFAPMVEMYGLGHHILQRGQVQPGETVAILGVGRLGLSILDVLCHNAGAAQTIVTDIQPYRLQVAHQLGADYTLDLSQGDPVEQVLEITHGEGVDCVIEAVGHFHLMDGQEAPLAQAVKMIRQGGRIVTAGLGEQLSALHFKTLVLKEAQIIASRVTLGEFPRALRLMAKNLLHPDLLITHRMPASQVTDAFRMVDQEAPDVIKVVMDIQK